MCTRIHCRMIVCVLLLIVVWSCVQVILCVCVLVFTAVLLFGCVLVCVFASLCASRVSAQAVASRDHHTAGPSDRSARCSLRHDRGGLAPPRTGATYHRPPPVAGPPSPATLASSPRLRPAPSHAPPCCRAACTAACRHCRIRPRLLVDHASDSPAP